VLLCGFPPYEGTQGANGRPDYPKTLSKIQQRCDADGRFDYFPDPYWSSISKSAQDLIRSMVLFPPLKFSFLFSCPLLHDFCQSFSTSLIHTLIHTVIAYLLDMQVVLDPAKRLSADACLKHPWLSTLERRPSTDRPPTSPTFFVEALERIRGINADRSKNKNVSSCLSKS
jgi:serine/threonine protein kinase